MPKTLFVFLREFSSCVSSQWSNRSLESALTHLLSAFLCRCSFRYHSSRLFLGRKRETASARSCHPWISTYCAGLVLQSKIVEVEWPCMSGGLWEVEAVDCASAFSPLPFAAGLCVSQVKSDCVAQRRSCCNGMLAYYYVPEYYIYSANPIAYFSSSSKSKRVNVLLAWLRLQRNGNWSNISTFTFYFTLFYLILFFIIYTLILLSYYFVNRYSPCVYALCVFCKKSADQKRYINSAKKKFCSSKEWELVRNAWLSILFYLFILAFKYLISTNTLLNNFWYNSAFTSLRT